MCYYASNMILIVDSDAVYLVMPQAKSHIDSYFQMANNLKRILFSPPNGAILVEYKILYHIVSSAAEVEIARVFIF